MNGANTSGSLATRLKISIFRIGTGVFSTLHRKYFSRLLKRLLALCLLGIITVALACGALVYSGTKKDIFVADALVVPGNAVSPKGKPSRRLAARLDRAYELYKGGQGKIIIVSGGIGRQGADEAVAMRKYLVGKGVPQQVIVADSNGYTTWDTARFTARYMKQNGLKSAVAVTQYFHVPRTRMALSRNGVQRVGKAYARFTEKRDPYSLLREIPAWLYYRMR